MSLTINSNKGSSIAHRAFVRVQNEIDRNMHRLSSGLRVSGARDDAAALAIGSRLKAEHAALRQHTQTATQTASMLQIAEGSYQRAEDMLVRMRSLAVQAQGRNISTVERGMLNTEYLQLRSELDRMGRETRFNGQQMFEVGDIGLQSQQNFVPGNNSLAIQLGDMNGDGIVDMVRSRQGSNVQIFFGNGDGTFATTPAVTIATTGVAYAAVRDVDSDGIMDLAFLNNGNLEFWKNDGNANFSAISSTAIAGAFDVGDFNGDGLADIVHQSGTVLTVQLNQGGGVFASQTYTVTNSANVRIMDLDNDGDQDIALINNAGTQQLTNNGSGGFTVNGFVGGGGSNTGNLVSVDANNDGLMDLAASDGTSVSIYLNNGNGTFGTEQNFAMAGTTQQAVYVGDINGDGFVDILSTGTASGGVVTIRQGTGVMSFASAATYTMGAAAGIIAWADTNRDGRMDFVFGNGSGTAVQSVLNTTRMGQESTLNLGGAPGSGGISYRIGSMALNSLDNELRYSNIAAIGSAARAEDSIIRALETLGRFRASVGAAINRLEAAQANIANTLENLETARSAYIDLDVSVEMSRLVNNKILAQGGIAMMAQSNETMRQLLRLFEA